MKLYKENSGTRPAAVILPDSDSTPEGFIQITDIVDASEVGLSKIKTSQEGFRDKLSYRSLIKDLVYAKMGVTLPEHVGEQAKWDELDDQEKQVACNLFIVKKESFFIEVVNDIKHWDLKAADYRCWSMSARTCRAELAEGILFNRIADPAKSKQLLADLSQIALDTVIDIDDVTKKTKEKVRVKRLNQQYIEGLEDFEHDGIVAIVDWIQSTVGTPYENNGFMSFDGEPGYDLEGSNTFTGVRDDMLAALAGTY